MLKDTILYRGDSVVNEQSDSMYSRIINYVNKFYTEGLMAKSFGNNGGLEYGKKLHNIDQHLTELILAHVGYDKNTKEQRFVKNYSPFLSFTTDIDTAFDYMDRTHKKKFIDCNIWECTHFIFELKNIIDAQKITKGIFQITYKKSSENFETIKNECIKKLKEGKNENLVSATVMHFVHQNLDQCQNNYCAWLVDVSTYLNNINISNVDDTLYNNSIQRSNDSKEWLLLPLEPMEDGCGYSWRFSLNDYLFPLKFVKENKSAIS